MLTGVNNSQNFTSVVPVKFYARNANGKAEIISDAEKIKSAKKAVIKLLSGPAKNKEQENIIRELAIRDPDYNYVMAKNGTFSRPINGIFKTRPAREFLRFISDEFPEIVILLTGPQAIKLSVIGEKIGKIKKKCMNLTAIGLGIPPENTLVKGKSLHKWTKKEKEIINKNLINTEELIEEKHRYGQAIRDSFNNKNLYLTNFYNNRTNTREGDRVILNFLINNNNEIENFAVTAYK